MKFKVLKPFVDAETKEEYEAEQIVEMTVARALAAVERLAAHGGGFLGVAEDEIAIVVNPVELDGEAIGKAITVPNEPNFDDLTVDEIKEELDKLEVPYNSKLKRAELLELLKGAQPAKDDANVSDV